MSWQFPRSYPSGLPDFRAHGLSKLLRFRTLGVSVFQTYGLSKLRLSALCIIRLTDFQPLRLSGLDSLASEISDYEIFGVPPSRTFWFTNSQTFGIFIFGISSLVMPFGRKKRAASFQYMRNQVVNGSINSKSYIDDEIYGQSVYGKDIRWKETLTWRYTLGELSLWWDWWRSPEAADSSLFESFLKPKTAYIYTKSNRFCSFD